MKVVVRNGRAVLDRDDPALRLTEAQKQALELGREIVVTAGAGAGKTHTLALRYAALFLELAHRGSPDIDAVAVLTFTEKAAAEMAERCYQRLGTLAQSVRALQPELDAFDGPMGRPLGGHLVAALDRLCDRFDGARIHTFHGFCARILREFPVESGTPLDTRVLDPVEAAGLRLECLETTLLRSLEDDPEGLGALLDAFGSRSRLIEAGATALAHEDELGATLKEHAGGLRTIEQRVAAAPWTPSEAGQRLDELRTNLTLLARVLAPGASGWAQDRLTPTLASLPTPTGAPSTEAALSVFAALGRVVQLLLMPAGTLRTLTHHSVMGPKASWPDPGRHRQARRALEMLTERFADLPTWAPVIRELPTPADRTLIEVLRPFCRWVLDAQASFDTTLAAQRAIDFSQMQQRAVRAVLESDAVRDSLVARHRYLVVDEFQDTDARQWALVRAIGRPDGRPADRIFLVGDAKQAIYGFRGGDVTVFRRATDALGVRPIVLPHNFRSRTEIIDWFNEAFPAVLAPAGQTAAPHEAPYEPLIAGRGATGGSVSLVLGDRAEEGEADAVAHLVATEILPGVGPYAGLSLSRRDLHPAPPIAVLLRRRTRLTEYEDALRRRGIPYAVAQGVGFWGRPEIVDLTNQLHGLVTGDPVSVAGALRSPAFWITDQELTDLGPDLARFGLGPAPRGPQTVAKSWSAWRSLRDQSQVEPAAEVLRTLVEYSRPGWSEATSTEAGRAEANAQRLIELATDLASRLGVHGTAEFFLAQVQSGTREPEAALAPDRARVLLLTVHAAKGLEFPVVLVPEIDVPPRPDTGALSIGRPDRPEQWELAFAVSDDDAEVQQRTRPGLLEAVQRAGRAEADAELMRLLYVAATRARDHLVLLGNDPTDRSGRPSWADVLLPQLPASTRLIRRSDLLATPLPDPPAVAPPQGLGPASDSPARSQPIEISASSLDRFAACPARWYRSSRLGLPERVAGAKERARDLAGLRGRVLHGLLEDDAAEDEDLADRRWRSAVLDAGFSAADVEEGRTRLHAHRLRAASNPHLQKALAAPGHAELALRASHGNVTLRGQIDRLYFDDGWVVLDYKTEALRVTPERQARSHRRQLLAYAWAADRVLCANDQPGVSRAEVYFTETGATVSFAWDEAARAEVVDQLAAVGRVAAKSWRAVEALATTGEHPRPCATCGYRGRGCRGVNEPEP